MTPQQARSKLKILPENDRLEVSNLIDRLSLDQKYKLFDGWGKFISIDLIREPDPSLEEQKQFVEPIENLSKEYECNFIYMIITSPRILILIPNQSIADIINTIKNRLESI